MGLACSCCKTSTSTKEPVVEIKKVSVEAVSVEAVTAEAGNTVDAEPSSDQEGEVIVLRSSPRNQTGGEVIVLSGPSGVGKGTLLQMLKERHKGKFGNTVSHTTRKPRDGEVDGVDYHYITTEEFNAGIENGIFLEHATYSGNSYGTSIQSVKDVIGKGQIPIIEIEIQGAQIIKNAPSINSRHVFITTTGDSTEEVMSEIESRLRGRHSETEDQIKERLAMCARELKFRDNNPDFFDLVLINERNKQNEAMEKLEKFILNR